jgi:cytochrome oxidase Cu insertion factor (SCO1/SenC/PrrC family)
MQILTKLVLMIAMLSATSLLHAEVQISPLYQADMHWTDDSGNQVILSKWQNKVVVLTMAFSTCRKFCPITLHHLAEIQNLYNKQNISAEFIIISYDPAIDTWQTWKEFRKNHHYTLPNWHFLTGSSENTKMVSQLLGMDYWLYDEHVMHNLKIVLLNAHGEIQKSLEWDNQTEIESFLP